ncbi:MAG: hypothetical protein IKB28_08095 [Clostridia bacterium]|nr:hypothetical protein [Clostridia bacterium]
MRFDKIESFNRYTLIYSADAAVRGTMTYMLDGVQTSEEFFLEAGENKTFRCLIDGYLAGKAAKAPVDIQVDFIKGGSMIKLHELRTELIPAYQGDTYYMENEYFRVGIELAWGGGLSYFADKHAPDGLGNLLNNFDTGRLVQQSYYGTSEPPFVCGEFMGNRWGYNPVQGGDRTNAKSKLVDLEITEKSVYIKCRPRDWGHEAWYTPSYMENTYAFDGDVVRVDNRFVDFSGWEHPKCTQEVPAFYTISYLGNFWFYDGEKPWTGDALSVRRDLIFWPEDWPRHRFPLPKGDTETWCAWTDDNDWGIGLYVPGVEKHIGGRHAYNGTKEPHHAACNYVAPLKSIKLLSFVPLEYSYLIYSGSLSEIRAKFTEKKDFCVNECFENYGK